MLEHGQSNMLQTQGFEVIFFIIFSVDLLVNLYVARSTLRHMCSFTGIIDVLSVLPFITIADTRDQRTGFLR
jgi:hypothetical protein